jgi:hypothetical protein
MGIRQFRKLCEEEIAGESPKRVGLSVARLLEARSLRLRKARWPLRLALAMPQNILYKTVVHTSSF